MACGCADRCRKWRAQIKKWELQEGRSRYARKLLAILREKVLTCDD